ncbi:MAG TPA: hypothetical protein VMC44_03540, partial [Geobacteraceae bacterium]|nr:hypothetical protein [Geobacteraceae bacterium]
MKKTFIHHDGALGDLLLSLPAISLIRKDSGFVHLAGRADVVVLLLEAGMIDGASPVGSSGYASLYGDSVAPELRDFLEGFDSSVVFTTIEKSAVPISIA